MSSFSRVERLGQLEWPFEHQQLGASLAGIGGLFGLWLIFWPVPTQVDGQGVLIYPDNAGILNARSGGQVLRIDTKVGEPVRQGQVLMTLYLPVLERQLDQQKGNFDQLILQNETLNQRDALRIATARAAMATALAKLDDDQKRLAQSPPTPASSKS